MHLPHRLLLTLMLLLTALSATAVAAAPSEEDGGDRVSIIRDEFGVPHVYGSTLKSVWYGVGYATGQDRLWQADVLRRLGTGTSAEFFGLGDVAGDITARALFGPPERRTALFEAAAPDTQTILESFAAGMNAWITEATVTGQLPIEYIAQGLSPRPWMVDDSIAFFMALLSNFGEAGADELDNAADLQELIGRFGPAEGLRVFADTHWLNDPSAPTSVPPDAAIQLVYHGAAAQTESSSGMDQAAAQFRQSMKAWRNNCRRVGVGGGPASNAIAIGPKLSSDGHALLLSGPQLGYAVPQISHEMGIHGAGFNVTGMAVAGLPGIVVGVAKRHAWSLTSGGSDNNDIYLEKLNPANPKQYEFMGTFRDLECRVETIVVKGHPDVTQQICESVHGPVLGTAPGVAFTFKTATRGLELQSYEALLGVMRAKSMPQFQDALSQGVHNFNALYADAKGNIAYWHVGRIPIRAVDDNPWLPHDGTGSAEWQGFIPWEQMPRSVNPDQGWLTSWNNKPMSDWPNSTRGFYDWGPVHRVNTLINQLRALQPGTVSVDTLKHINLVAGWTTDTPSGGARTVFVSSLLGDLLSHVDDSADSRLPEIVALLTSWDLLQLDQDLDGRYDSPAVAVFNTWWQEIVDRIFADDLGGALQDNVVGNLVARLLRPNPALPLLHDYLGGEALEDAITSALIQALNTLTASFSSPSPVDWLQSVALIHWAPIGAGTVPATIWMNRGTYNQITHLGMGARLFAENVVSPGQSGNPFSPHFADQLSLYATWTYKPMRLTRNDLQGHPESVVKLKP